MADAATAGGGRQTGKRRRNVVGLLVDGDAGWVVAEQGRHAGWVANVDAEPNVRLRQGRRWLPARGVLVPDDDVQARLDSFGRRTHAAAVRTYGTALTSVRFEFEPEA